MPSEQVSDQERADLRDFRNHLLEALHKSSESFDRTIFALSGGGLGLSMAFLKDIVKQPPVDIHLLFTAWSCWVISLVAVMISYALSRLAIQHMIHGVDARLGRVEPPVKFGWGSLAGPFTQICNGTAAAGFLSGLYFMARFVYVNL